MTKWEKTAVAYAGLLSLLIFGFLFKLPHPIVDNFFTLDATVHRSWPTFLWDAFIANKLVQHSLEYRPLWYGMTKLLWELGGSYDRLVFRFIHAGTYFALGLLLVFLIKPREKASFAAFAVSLHCLISLHTSGILFAAVPWGGWLFSITTVFAAFALLQAPPGPKKDLAVIGLTLFSCFFIELGGMGVAMVFLGAWLLKIPSVSRRAGYGVLGAGVFYAVVRLAVLPPFIPSPLCGGKFYTYTGYLCGNIDVATHCSFIERFPLAFYLYNVAANTFTILFSEPRGGTYWFMCGLGRGEVKLYAYVLVGSSVVATTCLGAWLARKPWDSVEKKTAYVALAIMLANALLGFLYARDRIPVLGGTMYALALGLALRHWFSRPAHPAIKVLLFLLVFGWLWRTAGMFYALKVYAWETKQEWMEKRYDRVREMVAGDPARMALLEKLRNDSLKVKTPDPRVDGPWVHKLLTVQY